MARIAVAHPWLRTGGSEARALWCVQALRDAGHQVALVTTAPPDRLSELNLQCGTSLLQQDFVWHRVPLPLPTSGLKHFKWRCFELYSARLARRFDVFISAYNPLDIEGRCLQFVADFSWDSRARVLLEPESAPHGWRKLLEPPYKWLTVPRRPPSQWLGSHLVVANSQWTATRLNEFYGLSDCPVVHPPAMDVGPQITKTNRRGFLWLGRISPEKRLEDAAKIIEGVRAAGHNAELWVAGDFKATNYGRRLKRQLRCYPWVRFLGHVTGAEKRQLLRQAQFGLHTRRREPFGIAVAEMMKAGCLVFAPANAGPQEMLTDTPLLFASLPDAVDKIVRMLDAPQTWHELSQRVALRGQRYSNEAFCLRLGALVQRLLRDSAPATSTPLGSRTIDLASRSSGAS